MANEARAGRARAESFAFFEKTSCDSPRVSVNTPSPTRRIRRGGALDGPSGCEAE